jgi:ribonuclease HII
VDGPHPVPLDMPQQAVVRADATVPAVSAASILAKTFRDKLLTFLDRRYPGYEFGDSQRVSHRPAPGALNVSDRLPMHRLTFKGVLAATRGGMLARSSCGCRTSDTAAGPARMPLFSC